MGALSANCANPHVHALGAEFVIERVILELPIVVARLPLGGFLIHIHREEPSGRRAGRL